MFENLVFVNYAYIGFCKECVQVLPVKRPMRPDAEGKLHIESCKSAYQDKKSKFDLLEYLEVTAESLVEMDPRKFIFQLPIERGSVRQFERNERNLFSKSITFMIFKSIK